MPEISLLIRIAAQPARVYQAIATLDGIAGWFTRATSDDYAESEPLTFHFEEGQTEFLVARMTPDEKIVWRCTSEKNIWTGTEIRFALKRENETASQVTVVRFDHIGWPETTDTLRECAMSWAYFLESLKLYIETGKGTPESAAPPCELETQ